MCRFHCAAACAFVLLAGTTCRAQGAAQVPPAQGPYVRPSVSPYARPAVSPYLNLNRGGSTALNYYNLVRPQQDLQGSLHVLEGRADLLGQTLEEGRTAPLITGHPSQFMTHGRYFFNINTRSAAPRTATLPPAVTGAQRPGY